MKIIEYLKKTYKVIGFMQEVRPRIICNDGFSMSVQAGYGLYSSPRCNLADGNYESVEIGFPNEEEELIKSYAENEENYTGTVYPYVPVKLVEEVIEKHGGIKESD